MDVIDVGCGWGEYAFELEKRVKSVTGVEPYKKLYLTAEENRKKRKSKVKFYNKLIENFSTTKKYDLALSLTIVEHMPNAELSNAHIINLLKDGGMMYLTAPNKLWPKEPHYELYFLNWLPLSLANIYLKASGKGSSFEDASYARTYFGMKKLFNPLNCRYYFWLPDSNKAYLGLGSGGRTSFFIRNAGISLIKKMPLFWAISKGFIMVIVKKKSEKKRARK